MLLLIKDKDLIRLVSFMLMYIVTNAVRRRLDDAAHMHFNSNHHVSHHVMGDCSSGGNKDHTPMNHFSVHRRMLY